MQSRFRFRGKHGWELLAPGRLVRWRGVRNGLQSSPLTSSSNSTSDRMGIWELGVQCAAPAKKMRTIDDIDARTAELEQTFQKIRTPAAGATRTLRRAERCAGHPGGSVRTGRL